MRSPWQKLAGALGLVVCLHTALPAYAAPSLAELKEAAKVGETVSGYLGIVDESLDAESKAVVAEINAERRSAYERIAAEQGVALDSVAALAGKKLVDSAPIGQVVRDSTGEWKRK